MPKATNYFEEAIVVCKDADPNVACIAETLYQRMLSESVDKTPLPRTSFNMLYFIQTVIRLWQEQHAKVHLESETFPYNCQPIKGACWPNASGFSGRQSDLVHRFVEEVNADSVEWGDEFDVEYAVRILMLTFDDDFNLRSPIDVKNQKEGDFDYWLPGFNTPSDVDSSQAGPD